VPGGRAGAADARDAFDAPGARGRSPVVAGTPRQEEEDMERSPRIGNRLTDRAAMPDDETIRGWIGEEAFGHWRALRDWIEGSYPGVFAPDWLYGGKTHGWSLRYKRSKAFCTLLPERGSFSAVVVLGAADREKVEAQRPRLSPRLMKLYEEAATLHDGTWLKIPVSSAEERQDVIDLLALKRPRRSKTRPGAPAPLNR
jgi:hypothetical protein